MKNAIFLAVAALFLSAAVHAQSTVDSIEAKYKLVPMPGQLTIEQTFPAIGSYQLNGNTTTNLTITLDSNNKGVIWVEGLPQGRIKAYLKQSPATYRILPQKSQSGEQVPEGTLVYDSTTHMINIELGAPYNESDPTGVFALNPNSNITANAGMATTDSTATNTDNGNETKIKTEDGTKVKAEAKGNNTVKVKTKTPASKNKSKVTFYTGTKVEMNNTDQNTQQAQTPAATDQQQNSQQSNQPQQNQQPQSQQPQTQPNQQPQGQPQNQQ